MAKTKPLSELRSVTQQAVAKLTEAREMALLERRYQVWTLRTQGYTIRDISASLGISMPTVRDDIITIGKRLAGDLAETVEENRSLQISRLDALLKKYQPLAEGGSLSAAQMVLSIETRRSKLLALDVPETKKLEVSGVREYVGVDMDQV